jgi:predicted nucleic acid-binding protein
MLYLDTSLLVSAFAREQQTPRIQQWLREQDTDELTISDWVVAEFSSALSIKLRTGNIGLAARAEALGLFGRFCATTFTILPVSRADFRMAARFADQHTLRLRASDALHLAIAAQHGATLCTLDRPLSEATTTLGVKALLV